MQLSTQPNDPRAAHTTRETTLARVERSMMRVPASLAVATRLLPTWQAQELASASSTAPATAQQLDQLD